MTSLWIVAAWLCAVTSTCGATNVINEAAPFAGRHYFLSRNRQQRIHTHIQNATQNATTMTTKKAMTALELDAEAKEDFVRRCRVGMTVSHESQLPTKAMDSFCESTDAVVECKLQMAKMVEVHNSGQDMAVFCVDIYQWFNQKYGMNCPAQCEKMQCRGTCLWLKEQESIQEEEQKLDEKFAASAFELEKLTTFKKHNATLNIERRKREKTNGKAYAEFVYAEANWTEQRNYTLRAIQREQDMSKKVDEWETEVFVGKEKVNEAYDALSTKKFALDNAEQEHKIMVEGVDRANQTLEQMNEAKKALGEKVIKLNSVIEEHKEKKTTLEGALEEQKTLISDQEQAVEDAEAALQQATATFEEQRTEAAQALVVTKSEDLTNEKYKLHEMNKTKASIENRITFTQNYIDRDTTEYDALTQELQQKTLGIETAQTAYDTQRVQAETYMTMDVVPLRTEVGEHQATLANLTAQQDKLYGTLEFWTKAEAERRRSREAMQEGEKEAETKAATKRRLLKIAEGALADIRYEIAQNTKIYEEQAGVHKAEVDILTEERSKLDQKTREHDLGKPEIVTIHKLG